MAVLFTLKSVFNKVGFKTLEPEDDLDLCADIDYLGWVGDKAFGIQIKPITANANFGNYSPSERMKASFADFNQKYGGNVFIIFSEKEKISNQNILEKIANEITRLKTERIESI